MVNKSNEILPGISVIIPVYAIGNFLNQAIDSVKAQKYGGSVEVILAGNENVLSAPIFNNAVGSIEDVKTVCGNSDFASILLDAACQASGDYIVFLSSEDVMTDNALKDFAALTEDIDSEIIIGNHNYFNGDDTSHTFSYGAGGFNIPSAALKNGFALEDFPSVLEDVLPGGCTFFSKELIKEKLSDFSQENKHDKFYDDIFLLKALFAAKSILRTEKEFCGKRVSKIFDLYPTPAAASRHLSLYLDSFEAFNCRNRKTASCAYSHIVRAAAMASAGKIMRLSSTEELKKLRPVLKRIDFDVFAENADSKDVYKYFDLVSPIDSIQSEQPKILFYNWLPFDNKWNWGGGVTIYCKNVIRELLDNNPDVDIYFISSGFAYNTSVEKTYVRPIKNIFGRRVHQYEIVNSPVPAEQRNIYVNPLIALENEDLKFIFSEFMEKTGPYKAVHFNNIEGLSLDVLDLKQEFPETKFIFSIHNYVPLCVNGSYYMRHKHCNCNPEHTGLDCFECTRMDIRSHIASNVYNSGMFGISPASAISKQRWLSALGLDRLDIDVSPDEILRFAQTATEKLNRNCDNILAVSRRVYEIARDNGFDENKMTVSYIGTQVAKNQIGHGVNKAENGLKIVFLGSDINFEEKGYQFLLNALSEMDEEAASKIDLVLTVKQKEHSEIYRLLYKFRSLKVINGYTHDDLYNIFDGCDLSIVPVLWEDNLPQIAIESAAYGVPVLSSSAGGASELCDSELFVFECGNGQQLRDKIKAFLEKPELLDEYWKHHRGLVTMEQHMKELSKIYGISDSSDSRMEVASGDLSALIKENEYLMSKNDIKSMELISTLRRKLEKAEQENKKLKLEFENMNKLKGKIIFQTVNEEGSENIGAEILRITPEDFNFSDFYAEIKLIRLNNVAACASDTLKVSGTWFEEDGDKRLHIHQTDWIKGEPSLISAVRFYVRNNTFIVFVKHLGQFCGISFDVMELTNRAAADTVECEVANSGFIFKNAVLPGDAFGSTD